MGSKLFRSSGLAVAVFFGIALLPFSTSSHAKEEETVELDADEVKLIKNVLSRDEFLKRLTKSHAGLESFNKVLSVAAPGPLKLTYKWHESTFKAWGIANKNLAVINKMRICDDLMFPILNNSPNAEFFERMREVRGCDE